MNAIQLLFNGVKSTPSLLQFVFSIFLSAVVAGIAIALQRHGSSLRTIILALLPIVLAGAVYHWYIQAHSVVMILKTPNA